MFDLIYEEMQSKSGRGNEEEANHHHADQQQQQPMMYPEPWWKTNAFGVIPQERPSVLPSNSSSLDCPNGSESNDVHSASEDGGGAGNGENDAAWKDSQAVTSSPSGFVFYFLGFSHWNTYLVVAKRHRFQMIILQSGLLLCNCWTLHLSQSRLSVVEACHIMGL